MTKKSRHLLIHIHTKNTKCIKPCLLMCNGSKYKYIKTKHDRHSSEWVGWRIIFLSLAIGLLGTIHLFHFIHDIKWQYPLYEFHYPVTRGLNIMETYTDLFSFIWLTLTCCINYVSFTRFQTHSILTIYITIKTL